MNQNLSSILAWLYPDIDPLTGWEVRQDNATEPAYIARWDVPGVPKPTEEEIMAREDEWIAAMIEAEAAKPKTQLKQQALNAIADIDNYLAIADTATQAQVRAAVKGLAQVTKLIIKRLIEID